MIHKHVNPDQLVMLKMVYLNYGQINSNPMAVYVLLTGYGAAQAQCCTLARVSICLH